jgi:predicted dinucleotide-binding enzyme
MLGSRDASRARTVAQLFGSAIKGGSYAQAFAFSDVIMLATLWKDTPRIIKPAGSWENKILIDCSNPETLDGRELLLGHNTSGAEEIAKLATGARVVKAFNYVYAEVLDEGPVFGQEQASVFYCGDDGSAKHILADLIRSCGFDGIDAGPLKSARYLEPIAMLMVQLVRVEGHSPSTVALKLLRREIQICEHGSLNR